MITSVAEYKSAQSELKQLEGWLSRLKREKSLPEKRYTRAGVRKMIARLQEELAVYESTCDTRRDS